jgi:hypothetical protein
MIRTPIINAFIICLLATVVLGGAMLLISPPLARADMDPVARAHRLNAR